MDKLRLMTMFLSQICEDENILQKWNEIIEKSRQINNNKIQQMQLPNNDESLACSKLKQFESHKQNQQFEYEQQLSHQQNKTNNIINSLTRLIVLQQQNSIILSSFTNSSNQNISNPIQLQQLSLQQPKLLSEQEKSKEELENQILAQSNNQSMFTKTKCCLACNAPLHFEDHLSSLITYYCMSCKIKYSM